ncbi:uncharacterized protein LOC120171298 [Hibiscus syriacus]|uniref:uncharacterized protein LOC120171298 n=1 Tax=Hibiscus syriacus TaxID=106335 RepID=UPI0019226AFD|nr:uncharacterized protein LOC120171298 [Hibiscus syriacus]
MPWLVAGDFNEIVFSFERQSGRLHSERNMAGFRDALSDCDLADLGFKGNWAVANSSWWLLFPGNLVTHLGHSISDHCPVLTETKQYQFVGVGPQLAKFRFDANWVLEEEAEHIIKSCWVSATETVPDRLDKLVRELAAWNASRKRNTKRRKNSLQERL